MAGALPSPAEVAAQVASGRLQNARAEGAQNYESALLERVQQGQQLMARMLEQKNL